MTAANFTIVDPLEDKYYHFERHFFDGCIEDAYQAFQGCFDYLALPVDIKLVYDKDSPNGRIEFRKKEEQ